MTALHSSMQRWVDGACGEWAIDRVGLVQMEYVETICEWPFPYYIILSGDGGANSFLITTDTNKPSRRRLGALKRLMFLLLTYSYLLTYRGRQAGDYWAAIIQGGCEWCLLLLTVDAGTHVGEWEIYASSSFSFLLLLVLNWIVTQPRWLRFSSKEKSSDC